MAGDVAGLIAGQKHNRCRHVPRRAHAAQWNPRLQFFFHLVSKHVRHRRFDESGRDGVYRNIARRNLDGNRFRQSDQSCFGCNVIRLAGVPHLRDDGGNIDDPPRARPHHRGQCLLDAQVRTRQVGANHGIPIVLLHAHRQGVARDRRIVHQNVQPPELFHYRFESRLDLLRIGHIHLHSEGFSTSSDNVLHECCELLLIPRGDSDFRSRFRQRQRCVAPNALRRSRHQRDFVFQAEHTSRLAPAP